MTSRRDFLKTLATTGAATVLGPMTTQPLLAAADAVAAREQWDAGAVAHLLPTVNHERMLIKVSFARPLTETPLLRLDNGSTVAGERTDSVGEVWQFDASGLKPATDYRLALAAGDGRPLCEPWTLRTFPAPSERPERLRLLIYTCAGGHDVFTPVNGKTMFLPVAVRKRLLRRGLSFQPDALIANGDQVYWDLAAPRASPMLGASQRAKDYAGPFERAQPVFGTPNERFLKRAAGEQIAPLYGTDCRSTPVFFMRDDHDYFDNDEATDDIVTFPPNHWMRDLARNTQRMYYPEFLPDAARPAGLPGASALDRPPGAAESFGTLRYGTLAEVLLYEVRTSVTLTGPSAVFLDPDVERWLIDRMAAKDTAHLINIPSNPPGWSAGKWGEWYPDLLDANGKLSVEKPKPYWQSGWLKQHDRLMTAVSGMRDRIPLVVSGDLHAIAEGRMLHTGSIDLGTNPVNVVLSGPLGTGDLLWPSAFRGIGAMPPVHLNMQENLKPIEENGFLIADLTPDKIVLRFFRWNAHKDPLEAIDTLEPFRTTELKRPG
ncbi:twin-arginine translocation signal domain-containing protein [Bradyrhizobium sp. NP1]|uniref:twin-arginine translocation signal domain-containing protein n=1 Tax=Bradyrhizobium sp. NP1 TaxID=3049772 RepID=UPI0025A5BB49|nr:twin-arginine translocation signal domain-containing protein [Bradyrhizobium sp. NP1]WJR77762.1 twin-arginine translocation signal domain-containing protein [Bradyrhizobium sp. NP1]